MALAEECRHHRRNQHHQKPGRKPENSERQADGCQDLLAHCADGLDHGNPVGGLDARALQFVVEERIFIGGQVEARRVLHHHQADVAGEAVGEQGIKIADGPATMRAKRSQRKFGAHQPPEVRR